MSGESKSQMPMVSSSRHLAAEERRTVESSSVRDVGERIDGAELRRIRQGAESVPAASGHRKVYCGCPGCLRIKRANERRRRARIARGETCWGDLDAVIAHIGALRAVGMSVPKIARAAGVGAATLTRIIWPPRRGSPAKRVTVSVAERVLRVRFDPSQLPPATVIDATGTRRRLQALAVAGWSFLALAEEYGTGDRQQIRTLAESDRCCAGTHVRVADMFRRLWLVDPPKSRRSTQTRFRMMVERKGWVGIGAWDDDTIDDPNAVPDLQGDGEPVVDDVKVTIVLEGRGRFRTLNWPERADLARRWLERGGSKTAFETMFGVSSQTSAKCFSRIGTDCERKTA